MNFGKIELSRSSASNTDSALTQSTFREVNVAKTILLKSKPKSKRTGLTARHKTEYRVFHGAKSRCSDISNPNYGGRGIEFRFQSFAEFFYELGERPSPNHQLDRIDNDGHYEKGNVRWATRLENVRNRRITHFITANGETRCLAEWESILGGYISDRLERGWCDECAITIPKSRRPKGVTMFTRLCPHAVELPSFRGRGIAKKILSKKTVIIDGKEANETT